jgi:phosphoglycerol transferase MdoB-like AlkP superfamily enzyme
VENLRACSVVTDHRFADINGLLRTLGLGLSDRASQLLRVLAGGATLGLCWLGARRLTEPSKGVFLLALTTAYLMLFNPMNEVNSYVILAPVLAALAAFYLKFEEPKSLGWALMLMAVTMAVLPELLRRVYGNSFALWWHPLMTLVFVALLVWRMWRQPQSKSALERMSRSTVPAAH